MLSALFKINGFQVKFHILGVEYRTEENLKISAESIKSMTLRA